MKKLLFGLVAAAGLTTFGAASSVYWTVDATGVDGVSYAQLYQANGAEVDSYLEAANFGTRTPAVGLDSSYSYYVNLYNAEGDFLAKTNIASWEDFLKADAVYAPPAPGGAGTYTFAVPEPTSALLMLLGMAGLALKRKNA